jgi:hypothetical protein
LRLFDPSAYPPNLFLSILLLHNLPTRAGLCCNIGFLPVFRGSKQQANFPGSCVQPPRPAPVFVDMIAPYITPQLSLAPQIIRYRFWNHFILFHVDNFVTVTAEKSTRHQQNCQYPFHLSFPPFSEAGNENVYGGFYHRDTKVKQCCAILSWVVSASPLGLRGYWPPLLPVGSIRLS